MKIALGTDHAGFTLKEFLKEKLMKQGHEVKDFGAYEYAEDDDYPDFVIPAAEAVAKGECDRAIVLGGSGQGEAIAANKVKGIRAIVYNGESEGSVEGVPSEITLSREHNYANVLSLGARYLTDAEALAAVKEWLGTPAGEEERHMRRIKKIEHYEQYGTIS